MADFLTSPAAAVSQLAVKWAGKLKKLGIETVSDLIFYYPFRYDDFSRIVDIKSLEPGQTATVRGRVELIKNQRSWRRRVLITEAIISDLTGSVKVIWFGQYYIAKILKPGDEVFIAGRVDQDKGLVYYSPAYEKITQNKMDGDTTHTARLAPVYNLTKGLTSKQLRYLIKLTLAKVKDLPDYLPTEIKKALKFISLEEAVRQIHFPADNNSLERARARLKFDEFFLIQLRNQLSRRELKKSKAQSLEFKENEIKEFVAGLPFKLTTAQRQAAWEILKDLARNYPMNRLLEGDVGSGKTVVAGIAMLDAAKNGYQAALMAPTEILARQHFNTLSRLFNNSGVAVSLITRTDRASNQEWLLNDGSQLADSQMLINNSNIIIGTHALIQEKIKFDKLALAVVDEQHRFGVDQRQALQKKMAQKGVLPHFLSMTATPIPRSLALTIYGDLDLSILNEMPAGRKQIMTKVVAAEKRGEAYKFIRRQIDQGRQAFVICPLIDPSDKMGFKSVTEEFAKLDKEIFPDLKIGCLHGRLKTEEKEKIMREFLANESKILVSTSVIEVGVDVPNATVMMIEGAERFGLAQLHQFRGRVGRSEHQSYCFLFTDSAAEATGERLLALTKSQDGFKLAEYDLKFRGPGEVFGTAQSGAPDLRLANLFDFAAIKQARDWAEKIFTNDPELAKYPQLKAKLGAIKQAHLE